MHLALDNNNAAFARQIIDQLPPDRAAPLFQWAGLLESPQRSIDTLIASPTTPVSGPALLAGWKRLARMDPDAAKERYTKFTTARGLTPREREPLRACPRIGPGLGPRPGGARVLRSGIGIRLRRPRSRVVGARGALAKEVEAGGARDRGHVGDEPADRALALLGGPYERRVTR